MDVSSALEAFSALSQETRLAALRVLVEYGHSGVNASVLAERLGVPHNTLSFHLAHLQRAGLVESRRNGRQVIYAAALDTVQALIRFLLQNCCAREETGDGCCPNPAEGACSQ